MNKCTIEKFKISSDHDVDRNEHIREGKSYPNTTV
jgi:hypothetical protein